MSAYPFPDMQEPWLAGGDFNTILSREERLFGAEPNAGLMEEFATTLFDCGLLDAGFEENKFTWTNTHMFQRLDQVVCNMEWASFFSYTRIHHLNRDGSDHCPLLISCCNFSLQRPSSFRFLHAWVKHHEFFNFVANSWKQPIHGNGLMAFWNKQQQLKKSLKGWNKDVFGDIFSNLRAVEKTAEENELAFQHDPSVINRTQLQRASAKLNNQLSMEKMFWQQKSRVKWLVEGERNTRFFHMRMQKKRVKISIFKIQDSEELRLQEVKDAVFAIDKDSVAGLDGFSSFFYQQCWPIIVEDLLAAVRDFFKGAAFPRGLDMMKAYDRLNWDFLSLVLERFGFNGWENKILSPGSRITLLRSVLSSMPIYLLQVLKPPTAWHNITFPSSEGGLDICSLKDFFDAFSTKLWWRFDTCQSLWARYMRLKYCTGQIHHNIAPKPHDSATWKRLIDGRVTASQQIRWRIGKGDIFFWHDAWMGDEPLVNSFPSFSQSMMKVNYFFNDDAWDVDKLKTVIPNAIVDEILKIPISRENEDIAYWALTPNGDFSTKSAWELLRQRKQVNLVGQLIWHNPNPDPISPSLFILAAEYLSRGLNQLFSRYNSLHYLSGCSMPVSHLAFADDIVIFTNGCHSALQKILAFLQEYEQRLFNSFLWGDSNEGKRMHWATWNKITFPSSEGGLDIRNLKDVFDAFTLKLWWRFYTCDSLWTHFLKTKYCLGRIPQYMQPKLHNSSIWKRMTGGQDVVIQNIRWKIGKGELFSWHDCWMGDQPLVISFPSFRNDMSSVHKFYKGDSWDVDKLRLFLPVNLINEILPIPFDRTQQDVAYWTLTSNGEFSTWSAWETIRQWQSHNTLALSFGIEEKGIHLVSKCVCCNSEESLMHVLWGNSVAKQGRIRTLLPIFICWFLWLERNDAKHRHSGLYTDRVVWRIMTLLRQLQDDSLLQQWQWKGDTDIAAMWRYNFQLKQRAPPQIVYWRKPFTGEYKLNVDGSSRNGQHAASGGVLRDHTSKLIFCFSENIGTYNSLQAELRALHRGLLLCKERHIEKLWIEMDALAVIQLIPHSQKGSHDIRYLLESIKKCLNSISYRISHIFREGNQAADFLSNEGHNHQNLRVFTKAQGPPNSEPSTQVNILLHGEDRQTSENAMGVQHVSMANIEGSGEYSPPIGQGTSKTVSSILGQPNEQHNKSRERMEGQADIPPTQESALGKCMHNKELSDVPSFPSLSETKFTEIEVHPRIRHRRHSDIEVSIDKILSFASDKAVDMRENDEDSDEDAISMNFTAS
ncbi:Uncharacterized protein TCM_016753 [Theobroma cacao]|uniref:RNase H type-1 domain-containing protein n=1 Tax=Theobroma cacao TaxID=3641 RepID=A0A061G8F3_THECC|nr:Uncharacterized protein TCM_016753 [Theobroma cacao]